MTNRLLFEAGFGTYISRWGGTPMPGQNPNLIRTVDQCTTGVAPGQPCEHGIANITFRSPNWGVELDDGLQLAGQRFVQPRRAQPEGRLPGFAPR